MTSERQEVTEEKKREMLLLAIKPIAEQEIDELYITVIISLHMISPNKQHYIP